MTYYLTLLVLLLILKNNLPAATAKRSTKKRTCNTARVPATTASQPPMHPKSAGPGPPQAYPGSDELPPNKPYKTTPNIKPDKANIKISSHVVPGVGFSIVLTREASLDTGYSFLLSSTTSPSMGSSSFFLSSPVLCILSSAGFSSLAASYILVPIG